MRRLNDRLIKFVGNRVPELPKSGCRVLMFHSIGGVAYEDKLGLYSINERLFSEHIRFLKITDGIEVIPSSEACSNNNRFGIAITFDDGYSDNLTTASPILLENELPFTVFVATKFIKSSNRNFLDIGQLKELASTKFVSIGSHGSTHIPLTGCASEQIEAELGDNKKYLEDLLCTRVEEVSYPHGAVNARVVDVARKLGFKFGFSSRPGLNDASGDHLMIKRTEVWDSDDSLMLQYKLKGAWDWRRFIP
jgi:peptidoglycan/xylan/chitin deacetylase (PgdA/CDA1 family)